VVELSLLTGRPPGPVVPISQPTLPPLESYVDGLRGIFARRQITNDRWVRELEARAASYLGCAEVVAVANATAGLILMARLLRWEGEVCLPSFTFPATLHALLWNGLRPRLVDCDPDTFNLDPASLESALAFGAKAVVPVYIFGNSPDWERLEPLLKARGLSCYSDAAHALGTRWESRMAGNFGDAEIFSLAPTKVTVAGEGGLIATNNKSLAEELRVARNYGNPGDYDCVIAGLNARMSELHALLATLCLEETDRAIEARHVLADRYRTALTDLPGVSFQRIDPRCRTTYNYFAVRLDAGRFGLSNLEVRETLTQEGIQSRIYFAPPLHRQSKFLHLFAGQGPFPGTERVLSEVLCLPLYTHMDTATLDRVVEAVRACHGQAERIRVELERRKRVPPGPAAAIPAH
jgi:dTDP-4-amino-4,6-dideoxygalactose transaminase